MEYFRNATADLATVECLCREWFGLDIATSPELREPIRVRWTGPAAEYILNQF